MKDYLVTALASKEQIRAFAITSKNLVEEIRKIHNYSPIAIAALGRSLSASLMMGEMLKNKEDLLTIIIKGDGPLKQIVVTSNHNGEAKGYASVPDVILPPNDKGHLNVGCAIGKGTLTVIKDYGLKEPYVSTIDLVTSEIAEDLTYYFSQSEQTPTAIGLGVLLNKQEVTVAAAGGFIVQLMPNTPDETITKLEDNLNKFTSVTDILRQNKTPEELLKIVLDGFDVQFTSTRDVFFRCSCSKEKGLNAIRTLSNEEIQEIIKENKDVEITCDFCNKTYIYTPSDLEAILKEKENSHD